MIRKAKFDDIFEIKTLIDLGALDGKVLKRSMEELAGVLESFHVWEENGYVVGCVSLEVYSPKIAEVRSLVVLEKYRGRGIGTKLIEACLLEAKEREIYEVLAITDQVKLFDTLGFSMELDNQYLMFLRLRDRHAI